MPRRTSPYQVVLLSLLAAFVVYWLRDPPYELHSAIHVVPTWIAIVVLLASTRYFPLSNASFTLLVLFLALHIVGTRYIYSFVPYDQWARQLLGDSLGERIGHSRNHYDRFVHFCYGLLVSPAAREVQQRLVKVGPGWSYLSAIEFILASSMVFELAEWLGAVKLAPGFADSYLGQQGDAWDAHKDMGLAALGAVLSMMISAAFRFRKTGDASPALRGS